MCAGELVGEIGAAERDRKQEPQRGSLGVHLGRLGTILGLLELKPP